MKIKLNKSEVAGKVKAISRIISEKSHQEILSHILFKTDADRIKLFATNLETSAEIFTDAEIIEEGDFTLIANKAAFLFSNLAEEIKIESDTENKISIKSGSYKITTQGFSADDFPAIAKNNYNEKVIIDSAVFIDLLNQVKYSSLKEETRKQFLNGVFFKIEKNKIIAVASDGFRLRQVKIDIEIDIEKEINFIFPNKSINDFLSFAELLAEKIMIEKADTTIAISCSDFIFHSRIIDLSYPKYEQVIPKNPKYKIRLNKTELLRAFNLVIQAAEPNEKKINLSFEGNTLTIFISNTNNDAEYKIEIDTNFEEVLSVLVRFDYVTEYLKNIKTDEIVISLTDAKTQILFQEFQADCDNLYITMPMRM